MTLAEREDATRRVQGEGGAVGATQRLRTRTHDDDTNDNESAEVGLVGEWAGEVTAPPTPPSPGEGDSNEAKASRKREREVSLEPATPKTDEFIAPGSTERRMPVPKKNRVRLGTTREEPGEGENAHEIENDNDSSSSGSSSGGHLEAEVDPETTTPPPGSPGKGSGAAELLVTSPRFESNVRQISRQVSTMTWEEGSVGSQPPPSSAPEGTLPDVAEEVPAVSELGQAVSPTPPPVTAGSMSTSAVVSNDSSESAGSTASTAIANDNQTKASTESEAKPHESLTNADPEENESDKPLKRKIGDRLPSASAEEPPKKVGTEPAKRARDDAEEDVNPREKKRPTPPPEEQENNVEREENVVSTPPEPASPAPKANQGGFLAYASTSSPFASAKGPSVFGIKSTPSPSPLAGTSNGTASSLSSNLGRKLSPSPFASSHAFGTPNQPSTSALTSSPTGTKRSASGFEAFAAPGSPFAAAARSKSPTGALGRSKSPTRRPPPSTVNAFKSYVGSGVQSFVAPSPPIKKLRHDSGDDLQRTSKGALGGDASNDVSPEGSEEEESDKQASFGERLRARHDSDESQERDDLEKTVMPEQEIVATGEEEEDTIFQVRGKLYGLSEQNAWKERGTGLLKLNVRKSDGRGARLVMRKEAVFTLLLNVSLFKGMRCALAQDPRYVRFSVIESGSTIHYNLRLSNAKVAGELIEEINANIPHEEEEVV